MKELTLFRTPEQLKRPYIRPNLLDPTAEQKKVYLRLWYTEAYKANMMPLKKKKKRFRPHRIVHSNFKEFKWNPEKKKYKRILKRFNSWITFFTSKTSLKRKKSSMRFEYSRRLYLVIFLRKFILNKKSKLSKKQFRVYLKKILFKKNPFLSFFLKFENRLDRVLVLLGFSFNLKKAHKIIKKKEIYVNGKSVGVYQQIIKTGDTLQLTLIGWLMGNLYKIVSSYRHPSLKRVPFRAYKHYFQWSYKHFSYILILWDKKRKKKNKFMKKKFFKDSKKNFMVIKDYSKCLFLAIFFKLPVSIRDLKVSNLQFKHKSSLWSPNYHGGIKFMSKRLLKIISFNPKLHGYF